MRGYRLGTRRACGAPSISCQPLRRFLHHAYVGIFFYVDIVLEEPDLLLELQVALQRAQIRHAVRIAILILAGEGPFHAGRRRLVESRDDVDRFFVIFRIAVPAYRPHGILEEIDQRRAVHMVSCVMPNASFCVNRLFAIAKRPGSSENGGTALMRSAFFSASIARMAG